MTYQGRLKIGTQFLKATVVDVNTHLPTSKYLRIGPAPAGYQLYISTTGADLHKYDAGGDSWISVTLDADFRYVSNIWTKASTIIIHGGSTSLGEDGVWVSTDSGATWTFRSVPGGNADCVGVGADGRIWVASFSGASEDIRYSDDLGATWTSAFTFPGTANPVNSTDGQASGFIITHRTDKDRVACFYQDVADGSIHSVVTSSHGGAWTDTLIDTPAIGGDHFRGWISSWTSGGNLTVAFFVNEPGPPAFVWVSNNDGGSWSDISGTFPVHLDPLNAAAVDVYSLLSMEDNVAATDKLWLGDGAIYAANTPGESGVAQHMVGEDHTLFYLLFADGIAPAAWKVDPTVAWAPVAIANPPAGSGIFTVSQTY